jgi:hypothetical protein
MSNLAKGEESFRPRPEGRPPRGAPEEEDEETLVTVQEAVVDSVRGVMGLLGVVGVLAATTSPRNHAPASTTRAWPPSAPAPSAGAPVREGWTAAFKTPQPRIATTGPQR